MKAPAEEKPPERVTCPQCSGEGSITKPKPLPGAQAIRITSPEIAFAEGKLHTAVAARDGWRKIAEALLAVAFGQEMRGFGDVPPYELLDGVRADDSNDATVAALRDALIGRAWRVRGKDGEGTCDYPLCPNRAHKRRVPLTEVAATFGAPHESVAEAFAAEASKRKNIVMRVCSAPGAECATWAQWVAARARGGTIQSR